MGANSQTPNELITLLAQHGLQAFLETTRTLVVLLNAGGRVVAWNPAFEVFQKTLSQTAAFTELLAPDDMTLFERSMKEAAHCGGLQGADVQINLICLAS